MARMFEVFGPTPPLWLWSPEQCEELLLIAALDEIKPYVPPDAQWLREFENHFFVHGNAVAFPNLADINQHRKRRALQPIEFRETDVYEYGRSGDKAMKAEYRNRTREQLAEATPEVRAKMVENAQMKVAALLPPHLPYEIYKEIKGIRSQQRDATERSREETRRLLALDASRAKPKTTTLELDKAVTLLKFASKPELRQQIIAKMPYEDAIAALERIEDSEVRDELIAHSLASM